MSVKYIFIVLFLFAGIFASAQVTTDPALPVASKKVVIIFDSSKESRLGYFTGDLYSHTGLITENSANSDDWKYVIGSWGNNAVQPKLTHIGNGIYQLEISPDIKQFYAVPSGENILKMAFVFRSSDGSKQTNNLYVNVYTEGLAIEIMQPANNSMLAKNQSITISAISSENATQKLFINETLLTQNTGTSISANYTFTESGSYKIIAEAISGDKSVRDTNQIFVRGDIETQPKPAAYRKGINYPSSNSAALVLWAPNKEFVYVLGDFNNWQPDNQYLMKKDGDYFWLEIDALEAGKEYAFQYFIDGKIKIADPYTEKILDPWNDPTISAETYPGLRSYPTGKTEGIVSVLQPGQVPFNWEVTNFQVPDKQKLVIYELLVRDFMTEHTYKAVREKLDYLEDLRINVLELMPVNEFEGNSSWGYNPSFYFAPDKYYGPKEELKKLIDECHKRGIAVVIDMVLNHSYGQSPFVQMYMDNWTITPDNPWYNKQSNFQNTSLQWGYDFNHESAATRELVDSVAAFWMKEYKIDGFRFDFTKGFSNTPYSSSSWGSEYDAPRIANLKRMSSEIWKRNPKALVIFEHLAENSEETELANSGIMLWGNMHGSYTEAARGNTSSSDLSWALYNRRGWNGPNLVSYPESHDEERIMYTIKQTGLSNGSYNIKNQTTALKRIELNSLFHILLPGPKMIWQFGERGYDQSINRCENGTISNDCRLSPKPSYWQYLNNPDRVALFKVMAKLNELKQTYEEFSPETFTTDLTGAVKSYRLTSGGNHAVAIGNFDVTEKTDGLTFPITGKWYEFFTRDSVEITTANQSLTLAPGEYRLYSTRKFDDPHVVTKNKTVIEKGSQFSLYPNPAKTEINISSPELFGGVKVYSVTGKLMFQENFSERAFYKLNLDGFVPGVYLLQIAGKSETVARKFTVQ